MEMPEFILLLSSWVIQSTNLWAGWLCRLKKVQTFFHILGKDIHFCFDFTSILLKLLFIHMKILFQNLPGGGSGGAGIDHFCLNEAATGLFIPYLFKTK